ncbi:MAG: ferric reductase-like transmembrane domain-containing protein [Candidatus Liptonbacteria bacterium]|nr:ferric reductase-like transmembrane domain-containing protein [Candidatus Liptonbacteria bacterium]
MGIETQSQPSPPAQAGNWKKGIFISLFIVALSFLYAFLRYNVVRNVPYEQIPLFISNKVFALSSLIIIGSAFLLGPLAGFFPKTFLPKLYLRKPLGLIGFGVAALHSFISLAILNPSYYPKLFDASGKLNFVGETSLLFGILAFAVFSITAISSIPAIEERMRPEQWKRIQRLGYLVYFFVLMHVAIMGFKGWFDPASYKYGLVSISLISVLFIIFVFILRILAGVFKKKN